MRQKKCHLLVVALQELPPKRRRKPAAESKSCNPLRSPLMLPSIHCHHCCKIDEWILQFQLPNVTTHLRSPSFFFSLSHYFSIWFGVVPKNVCAGSCHSSLGSFNGLIQWSSHGCWLGLKKLIRGDLTWVSAFDVETGKLRCSFHDRKPVWVQALSTDCVSGRDVPRCH